MGVQGVVGSRGLWESSKTPSPKMTYACQALLKSKRWPGLLKTRQRTALKFRFEYLQNHSENFGSSTIAAMVLLKITKKNKKKRHRYLDCGAKKSALASTPEASNT